jgi:hypothetical protein
VVDVASGDCVFYAIDDLHTVHDTYEVVGRDVVRGLSSYAQQEVYLGGALIPVIFLVPCYVMEALLLCIW